MNLSKTYGIRFNADTEEKLKHLAQERRRRIPDLVREIVDSELAGYAIEAKVESFAERAARIKREIDEPGKEAVSEE